MPDHDKFLFDLNGYSPHPAATPHRPSSTPELTQPPRARYVVVKGVYSADEVAATNAGVDAAGAWRDGGGGAEVLQVAQTYDVAR